MSIASSLLLLSLFPLLLFSENFLCSLSSSSELHRRLHNQTYPLSHTLSDYHPFTQLVVSWCIESISWLEEELPHFDSVYLYSKCEAHLSLPLSSPLLSSTKVKVFPLPNIGMCDHTYLHHITHHWDTLANWTVFYKGILEKKCPPRDILPSAQLG